MDDLYGSNTQTETEKDAVYVSTEGKVEAGDEISGQKFNFILGLTLFWGFAVNYIMFLCLDVEALIASSPYFIPACIIGYFFSCIVGGIVYKTSTKPMVSFLGYNLVVLPLGVILSLLLNISGLAENGPELIKDAVAMTGIITLIMMALGSAMPELFNKIIKVVSIILVVTVVIEFVASYFTNTSSFYNIMAIGALCVYIGYDWGKANALPKTVDNAIDGAASLYMDIIALFVRVLLESMRASRKNR